MTEEQIKVKNRLALIGKLTKKLAREIKRLNEGLRAKERERNALLFEECELKRSCSHDYEERIETCRSVLGICKICGFKKMLKKYPRNKNCDCISCFVQRSNGASVKEGINA